MAMKTKKAAKPGAGTKAQAFKPPKLTPAPKVRSKSQVYTTIAEQTGLARRQVAAVFDALGRVIQTDLGRSGPGVFKIPGLIKITRVTKPAQPARINVPNPFKPGETMNVPAKPARNVVKVRALKNLKAMV